MNKIESYKDLIVWKKSILLIKEVYSICNLLPEDEKFGLISQMKRSSISIPSNIAEGWGRGNNKYFSQFLKHSRGSLVELETQIIIALELGFVAIEKVLKANELISEINKMLNSLLNKLNITKD